MKLEKLIKFTDFLIQEITQDWILAGRSDRIDKDAIMIQARAISEELIKDYPSLSLSYLHLLPKIIRKRGDRIDWKSIASALDSPEYQFDVKDVIDQERKNRPQIGFSESIPSALWKSVQRVVITDSMGTPNDYEGDVYFDRVLEYRQFWTDNRNAILAKVEDLYSSLQQAGWKEDHEYTGREMQ